MKVNTTSSSSRSNRKDEFIIKWITISLFVSIAIQILFFRRDTTTTTTSEVKIDVDGPIIILIMGLPESGSLAIHEYLSCQGLISHHYCCDDDNDGNRGRGGGASAAAAQRTSFPCLQQSCGSCVLKNLQTSNKKAFQGCSTSSNTPTTNVQVWSSFDVELDKGWFLPQHFTLGLLYEQYPNSIWILNTRKSSYDWAKSIYHWNSKTRRFLTSFNNNNQIGQQQKQQQPPSKKNNNNKNKNTITAIQVEQDLDRSIQKIQNDINNNQNNNNKKSKTISILQNIYNSHTKKIKYWSSSSTQHHHLLLEINVDDDPLIITSKLDGTLKKYYNNNNKNNKNCQWKFKSPDNDWLDFVLPFS